MSGSYQGMVFIYRSEEVLKDVFKKVPEILLDNYGFKYIDSEKRTVVEGKGIVKEYAEEDIRRLEFHSGAEWMANVKPMREYKIEDIKKLFDEIYGKHIFLYSVPFPPLRYIKKHGVEYDPERPYLMRNEDYGNSVEIYPHTEKKPAFILDFWSVHDYIEFSEPPLSRAVEDFLVDLMRDVARETKPEYAYMNIDEREPLEYDPVCDSLSEMVRFVDDDGKDMYTKPCHILYIRKEVIERECGRENLGEVYHPFYRDRYRVHIEDLGDYYLLYPENFVYITNHLLYRCCNRDKEYEVLSKLHGEEVFIKGVCGDIREGLILNVTTNKNSFTKEDIIKRIKEWSERYGVNVKEIRFK